MAGSRMFELFFRGETLLFDCDLGSILVSTKLSILDSAIFSSSFGAYLFIGLILC